MTRERNIFFAPSILSADFSDIRGALDRIHETDCDWIHLDIMDGQFVPNITFGAKMVADIRKHTDLPLDVHLMTESPGNLIESFTEAGADYITFHIEAEIHAHRLIQRIKNSGIKAGISLVPSTPVSAISEILPDLDLILIMSVNPGFGGQQMIPKTLEKVYALKSLRSSNNNFSYLLSVDGGLNRYTYGKVRTAGADVLISGSAFFTSNDPETEVVLAKGEKAV